MCLIVLAHRASDRFPLVIVANRDEDYDRDTHDAHFWCDAPEVLGGRDAVANGSWLAVTRGGRFAAVTNLRGAERKTRSRGELVREFVTTDVTPRAYGEQIARDAHEYAGFHLLAGEVGGDVLHITPEAQVALEPGVHAFSNAPAGEEWPKMTVARQELAFIVRNVVDAEKLLFRFLQFLQVPRGTASVESEVFIAGDRYGTRASTVIVATPEAILFVEQSFTRGGEPYGENRLFRLER